MQNEEEKEIIGQNITNQQVFVTIDNKDLNINQQVSSYDYLDLQSYLGKANLSDQDRMHIESKIESVLREEVAKSKSRIQQKEETKSLDGGKMNVSIKGLENLLSEDKKNIEFKIENILREELATRIPNPVEIKNLNLESDIYSPPGQCQYEIPVITIPAPPDHPYLIAAFFKEDTLRIEVIDGNRNPWNLLQNEMIIGLKTQGRMWAKEIKVWDYWQGQTGSLFEDEGNYPYGPDHIQIYNRNMPYYGGRYGRGYSCSTLLFRKPKFLGRWTDMYTLENTSFWKNLGGKVVTFVWVSDTQGNPAHCNPPTL